MNNVLRRAALALGAVILMASAFSLSRVGSDLVKMQSEIAWIRPERDQIRQLYFVSVDAEIAKLRYSVSRDENSAHEFSRALGAIKQGTEDAIHANNKIEPSPFVASATKTLQGEAALGRTILSGARPEAAAASKAFDADAMKLRTEIRAHIDEVHHRGDALNAEMAQHARDFIYAIIFGVIGLVISYFSTKPNTAVETVTYVVADHSRSLDLGPPRN